MLDHIVSNKLLLPGFLFVLGVTFGNIVLSRLMMVDLTTDSNYRVLNSGFRGNSTNCFAIEFVISNSTGFGDSF